MQLQRYEKGVRTCARAEVSHLRLVLLTTCQISTQCVQLFPRNAKAAHTCARADVLNQNDLCIMHRYFVPKHTLNFGTVGGAIHESCLVTIFDSPHARHVLPTRLTPKRVKSSCNKLLLNGRALP